MCMACSIGFNTEADSEREVVYEGSNRKVVKCTCKVKQGFFIEKTSGQCTRCDDSCQTCVGLGKANCTSCKTTQFSVKNNEASFKAAVANGYIKTTDVEKDNKVGVCECPNGLTLVDGICVETCLANQFRYYDNKQKKYTCVACHTTCRTCDGPEATDCKTCTKNMLPKGQIDTTKATAADANQCACRDNVNETDSAKCKVHTCNAESEFEDFTTVQGKPYCERCHATCKGCSGPKNMNCKKCFDNYLPVTVLDSAGNVKSNSCRCKDTFLKNGECTNIIQVNKEDSCQLPKETCQEVSNYCEFDKVKGLINRQSTDCLKVLEHYCCFDDNKSNNEAQGSCTKWGIMPSAARCEEIRTPQLLGCELQSDLTTIKLKFDASIKLLTTGENNQSLKVQTNAVTTDTTIDNTIAKTDCSLFLQNSDLKGTCKISNDNKEISMQVDEKFEIIETQVDSTGASKTFKTNPGLDERTLYIKQYSFEALASNGGGKKNETLSCKTQPAKKATGVTTQTNSNAGEEANKAIQEKNAEIKLVCKYPKQVDTCSTEIVVDCSSSAGNGIDNLKLTWEPTTMKLDTRYVGQASLPQSEWQNSENVTVTVTATNALQETVKKSMEIKIAKGASGYPKVEFSTDSLTFNSDKPVKFPFAPKNSDCQSVNYDKFQVKWECVSSSIQGDTSCANYQANKTELNADETSPQNYGLTIPVNSFKAGATYEYQVSVTGINNTDTTKNLTTKRILKVTISKADPYGSIQATPNKNKYQTSDKFELSTQNIKFKNTDSSIKGYEWFCEDWSKFGKCYNPLYSNSVKASNLDTTTLTKIAEFAPASCTGSEFTTSSNTGAYTIVQLSSESKGKCFYYGVKLTDQDGTVFKKYERVRVSDTTQDITTAAQTEDIWVKFADPSPLYKSRKNKISFTKSHANLKVQVSVVEADSTANISYKIYGQDNNKNTFFKFKCTDDVPGASYVIKIVVTSVDGQTASDEATFTKASGPKNCKFSASTTSITPPKEAVEFKFTNCEWPTGTSENIYNVYQIPEKKGDNKLACTSDDSNSCSFTFAGKTVASAQTVVGEACDQDQNCTTLDKIQISIASVDATKASVGFETNLQSAKDKKRKEKTVEVVKALNQASENAKNTKNKEESSQRVLEETNKLDPTEMDMVQITSVVVVVTKSVTTPPTTKTQ